MPGSSSLSRTGTPRGKRSTNLVAQSGPVAPTRPHTAHPTSLARRPPYRPPHTADGWQGHLKKPQYISTIREQVTVSDRLWTSYSKIMSLQPLQSTADAITSGRRMHASLEPGEDRDVVRSFPEGHSGNKWSLFTRRQTKRTQNTAGLTPESVRTTEVLLAEPTDANDFEKEEELNLSQSLALSPSIPETPKSRQETHHGPSQRTLVAGSPERQGTFMLHRRMSAAQLEQMLKSPAISPEKIDAEKARLEIEEKANKLRAEKWPEKRVIHYDLPSQQLLVVADQAAQATRESVLLVSLHARQKREKEAVRRRLLELYWKKGAIPASKKDDARRALELDDIESAQKIIEETETEMRQAARARAMAEIAAINVGKPLSPAFTVKLEKWRESSARRLLQRSSTRSRYLGDTTSSRFLGESPTSTMQTSTNFVDADAVEAESPELELLRGEVEVAATNSDETKGLQRGSPDSRTSQTLVEDRAERLKRLEAATKHITKTKSSVPGGLQTEKISLNSRKLNEVPDVLMEKSTQVKSLNLRVNDLSSIPDKFCMRLLNLHEVDLGFNQLSSLPPTLGLYVNENKLTGLPSSIGRLEKLQSLNLGGRQSCPRAHAALPLLTAHPGYLADKNNLCKLPPAMSNLSSLNRLSLKGNRTFSLPPQDVVDQDWAAIKDFLSKVQEDGCASRDILWQQLEQRQIKVSAVFLALDVEGEKKVDQATFEARMAWDLRFRMSKKELRHLWHILDEDGDGYITHHEFLYQLRRPPPDEDRKPDQSQHQSKHHHHRHHHRHHHSKGKHGAPLQGTTPATSL